jgi:hypothetical protein
MGVLKAGKKGRPFDCPVAQWQGNAVNAPLARIR